MNPNASPRRIQRVRRDVRLRQATVTAVQRLSPNFISVTLVGPDFADFESDSFDDHVKLIWTDAQGGRVMRDYTPRCFDRAGQTLTLEFALHDQGPASDWARQAQPGQTLSIGGPRGSMVIPMDYDWHWLVADASALPALHRRVEELPAGTQVRAMVLLDDVADRRELRSAAELQVDWLTSREALLEALRGFEPPPGEGVVWAAGEASLAADWRRVLLQERGHALEASKISAYWKRGAADFHEAR